MVANLTNFTSMVFNGVNNPDCAFFVGSFMGQFIGFKIIFMVVIGYICLRFIEKLTLIPLLEWLKKKLYGGNK